MELKNQFSAAYDAGESAVEKKAAENAWPWETTTFIVFAVLGSDAFRALLTAERGRSCQCFLSCSLSRLPRGYFGRSEIPRILSFMVSASLRASAMLVPLSNSNSTTTPSKRETVSWNNSNWITGLPPVLGFAMNRQLLLSMFEVVMTCPRKVHYFIPVGQLETIPA
jgi:hypothetical protein